MSASLALSAPAPELTVDAYPGDETELLGRLIRDFEDSETNSMDARHEAERCRDYVCGRQWTEEEARILRGRGQPVVWNNVIARKVALLNGMERRGRSDPKAFPRTPMEDTRADAATQALRYVADQNRFDVVRSSVYDNMLVEGFGGAEVIVEQQPVTQASLMGTSSLAPPTPTFDVVINHIPWDRLFYDPHSMHPGFSDARFIGVVIWMDRDEAIDRYPGCEDILANTFGASMSDTYDDKPRFYWSDNKRQRVRVVQEYWKRRDDWWCATFTQGGILDGPQKSPYLDRHGNATCPIIMRSALIDRDGNRFGIVRDMIPLQDSINKRESKLLHSISVNQLILEDGAVADVDLARREASKPDGTIVKNRGFEFEIRKDQAEIAGQFQMLQYAVEQMNVIGPNAAMSGKDPREQSGRAIIAQQAGGQTENEPIADSLRQWTHKIYEAAWMRVRQFWQAEMWIRVTDSDKNIQFVGLNRQVTLQDELNEMDPAQAQQIAQRLQLQPNDPRLQTVVRVENDISDMDVEITVEEGPDTPTMQAEQFQTLMQLPPEILAQFPPELIIKASSLRNKDDLIKLLEAHQQATAQAGQANQAAQQAMQKAQVENVQAQTADRRAQAVERLHNVAADHAQMAPQPIVQGVGAVSPDMNPLLQPAPSPPLQPTY